MVRETLAKSDNELILIWSSLADILLNALLTLFLAGGLLVSLLRYRLYDAEAAISRSAGYAVLTVMLGGVFAASAKGMEWAFERNFGGDAGALPGAIGAGLAVVLISPLHNRIHRWAERRFQKALLHLRRDLPLCVGDLRETAGLNQLLNAVLTRIGAGVRATRAAVLLDDKKGWLVAAARDVDMVAANEWAATWTNAPNEQGLDCDRSDRLFPLRLALTVDSGTEPETIGWILLGPRPDGSFYGKDEQEALAEIADPVARSIHVARQRAEREAHTEFRLSGLESALARLAANLTAKRTDPLSQPDG